MGARRRRRSPFSHVARSLGDDSGNLKPWILEQLRWLDVLVSGLMHLPTSWKTVFSGICNVNWTTATAQDPATGGAGAHLHLFQSSAGAWPAKRWCRNTAKVGVAEWIPTWQFWWMGCFTTFFSQWIPYIRPLQPTSKHWKLPKTTSF